MASNALLAFLSQFISESFMDEVVKEIDTTGDISEETLKKAGIKKTSTLKFLKENIKDIVPVKEVKDLTRSQLKTITGEGIDEPSLTDKGLEQRKGIFEQLGQSKETIKNYPGQLSQLLDRKLDAFGITNELRGKLKESVIDLIASTGQYPDAQSLKNKIQQIANEDSPNKGWTPDGQRFLKYGELPGAIDPLLNFANDQSLRDEMSKFVEDIEKVPDTSEDISRIEDILTGRATEAKREKDISGFIEGLPAELEGPRNARVDLLRELGGRDFERLTPQILARENAMGRLNSGAVSDVLGSAYGDIQANIESEAAKLKSGDEAFYFDAAYQNQIRKLMEGKTDLSSSLATERQNVRTQQQNRFESTQFDLNKNLENDILMQKYEASIRSAQASRERQNQLMNSQKRAGMFGGIGGAGVGIGAGLGALFALPTGGVSVGAGAAIGGGIGAGVGVGLPLLFGQR